MDRFCLRKLEEGLKVREIFLLGLECPRCQASLGSMSLVCREVAEIEAGRLDGSQGGMVFVGCEVDRMLHAMGRT